MKLHLSCMRCGFENFDSPGYAFMHLNDENVYNYTCKNGHINAVIHQQEKFELLFESASNAIANGYFREGVSSIAASLERFYEFCLRVFSVENSLPDDVFLTAWKSISKQSERQLGAFIFQYNFQFGKMPSMLSNSQIEFRNDVIHKGNFPTFEKTINYAQATIDNIHSIMTDLKTNCNESLEKVISDRLKKMSIKAFEVTDRPTSLTTYTIINLMRKVEDYSSVNFEQYILDLQKKK